MPKENYLNELEIQKNPREFISNRKETSTHISMEIDSLINRNLSEVKRYNEKVLYSFPLKSLVFSNEPDLLKFEEDIEINTGVFQIKCVNILNLEKINGIKSTQKLGVSFLKNWRDLHFKPDFPFQSDDPYHYKFNEDKNISVIFEAEKIMFSDEKKCIFNQEASFYFVSILRYEVIKNFIVDALANLKKVDRENIASWAALDPIELNDLKNKK